MAADVPPSKENLDEVETKNEPQFRRPSNASDSNPLVKSRKIKVNAHNPKYVGNHISTAKYSVISFLPAFLFEQFRRYSNIFFLAIALLQQIPDVSPTGKYTTLVPLLCILSVSALKEIVEDIKRHKADGNTNRREVEVLGTDGQWKWVRWSRVCVGNFVRVTNDKYFPADLVLFSSSEHSGICYIETSNLDGETNLKIRQGLPETSDIIESDKLVKLSGFLECELPNRNLYEFVGRLKLENEKEDFALGPDQILLRGAKLQNTAFIIGFVVYTGHQTKLIKNSTVAPLKRSTVDKRTNTQIVFLFILLILVSAISAAFSVFLVDHESMSSYADDKLSKDKGHLFLYSLLTFVILYNNLIPISLTVTLEVVRFVQALFINWDEEMYYAENDTPAMARTSNLNEELGQVSYIFSDKTGTLTRNVMEFKACSVFGKKYAPEDLTEVNLLIEDLLHSKDPACREAIKEFMTVLSVCHTVIPDYGGEGLVYRAASPDELALVYAAKKMGFVFSQRDPNYVIIDALGNEEKYEILNVLEFSSSRKRMSVIVKGPDGKMKLYCKGADSTIYENLSKSSASLGSNQKMAEHLEEFSSEGLRTLCCAVAEVSPKMYEEWKTVFHKAATAIEDREKKMDAASELIEKNLKLVGATAIEDKLQDEVPETIAAFIEAGVKVWILTGDKQETAINIGHSCRLLNQEMELLIFNRESLEATEECINDCLVSVKSSEVNGHKGKTRDKAALNAAVIIDGRTLRFALNHALRKKFLSLCCRCKAVIVCRASPIQKAEIVEYVTHLTGAITLAIGDGANDVAMIQKAHVGVGISGQEGLQAAHSSDYAIAQFRFLKKLLFVHGAWNYDRICKVIFYSYYKNICLYIIELWFAIYSAWTGQIIYERWTIGLYNMLFTCAQPLSIGIFERNCSQDIRMRYPVLYKASKHSFSLRMFFLWIFTSLLHSVIIFWLSLYIYGDGVAWGAGMEWGGHQGGYLVLGNFVYTYVVVVVSLKSGLITKSWTVFTHISIWGSILLWVLFFTAYSYLNSFHIPNITIGADISGIAPMVFTSPLFWIGLMIVPITTLLPDLCLKSLETTLCRGLDDAYRECDALKKDPDEIMKNRGNRKEGHADVYRSCLTCDNFSALSKWKCCCCVAQNSKTSPLQAPPSTSDNKGNGSLDQKSVVGSAGLDMKVSGKGLGQSKSTGSFKSSVTKKGK